MKPLYLDRSSGQNASFSIKERSEKNFLKVWHFHSELELVYLKKSTGVRYIGDSIEPFKEGEIVLIGKNVPHMWMNDQCYFEDDSKLKAEAMVIHFRENFAGEEFWNIPEIQPINELILRAGRGVLFEGMAAQPFIRKIQALKSMTGFPKVLEFLKLLHALAGEKRYRLLSSSGYNFEFTKLDKQRLIKVYNHLLNNFKKPVSLNEVAAIACMNPSAFSRYFKRVHRKRLTAYINELRVGYACKLLMENHNTISEICYESGIRISKDAPMD
jgi:AraC-like DNA-binding protein